MSSFPSHRSPCVGRRDRFPIGGPRLEALAADSKLDSYDGHLTIYTSDAVRFGI